MGRAAKESLPKLLLQDRLKTLHLMTTSGDYSAVNHSLCVEAKVLPKPVSSHFVD